MRPYNPDDFAYCHDALLSEGFAEERMSFQTDKTYITGVGFFSYRIESWCPRLVHFFVDKDKRSKTNATKLFSAFRELMIEEGHTHFVAGAPKEKPFMKRFIKYLGGQEPFATIDEDQYYLAPTLGRVRH